ncbi:helix-turn-helix domain-containing protein [Xanthomonas oryzae pv. oryzae]|nr:helix-turn-helix domain-containing protein [Xanthomonas oryzae]UXV97832.1 helix-turn-helix domain-containing protein [Xanthomonas oryzae pv. oryzae]UXW33514.1 helix-turn-helix domain-containing protein [Xanthomonas oryzae pv. oryzae]UXW37436.1 helix-turn-helix domain-containing protein [Xanthomonas oryzae pv. oryzae]UZK18938.1 helix-turn-helix domain-containing protein [Xanthomonas oryzae pv. oryzae]
MSKSYQHLSAEERAMLQIERTRGQSVRAISRILGRSPSTLSRELAKQDSTTYCARSACKRYRARRQLRTCSRSPEQQCQERQVDELQAGIEPSLAVLP